MTMTTEVHSSQPLARTQALARVFRDLAVGSGILVMALALPTMIARAIQADTAETGVDGSDTIRHEVPPATNEVERDRERRADLGKEALHACFERIDVGGAKNVQRIACLRTEQSRLQSILDLEAVKLRTAVAPDALSAMQASHRAWANFRDRWCELEAARNEPPHPRVNELFCSTEMMREYIVLMRKAA
jgi:hypothetical protein